MSSVGCARKVSGRRDPIHIERRWGEATPSQSRDGLASNMRAALAPWAFLTLAATLIHPRTPFAYAG
ncbi:hypothetical protein GE061_005178 [Apolygus lucorum]|uniref:Uncharacterized protein n=1 Tax=Apolygus lucorum TaxID=248454 RepID=A0A6A4IUU3_APOLU|nr:hypothetical protein GE061_005178 [Apolygus lucorum]